MHKWAKYLEKENMAERDIPDHYTAMVRGVRKIEARGRRRRQSGNRDNRVSLGMSWRIENELPVHKPQPEGDGDHVHHDGEVGGERYHGQVRRGDDVAEQVQDEEPVRVTFQ